MTFTIDIHDAPVLDHLTLKDGTPCAVVSLQPRHAGLSAVFHQAMIDAMSSEQKSFMLPKDASYFAAHMNRIDGNAVIAVVAHDTLIAQAIIAHPSRDWSETGIVDMTPIAMPHKVSVMQGVSVDMTYRGQGLMTHLVESWVGHAARSRRSDVLAEIDVRNIASWGTFLKSGLNLHSMGRDPSDGTLLYNVHAGVADLEYRALSPVFRTASETYACRMENIERQRVLFRNGYQAIACDKDQQTLIFEKRRPPKTIASSCTYDRPALGLYAGLGR